MSRLGRVYNHIKDDAELLFERKNFGPEHYSTTGDLPSSFDLRDSGIFPSILDQGQLGCCAGNEVSNALRFCLRKENGIDMQPSRLYIYYFGRMLDGSPLDQDTGMTISSAFHAVKHYGACKEPLWPYDISKFSQAPPKVALSAAHQHVKNFDALSVPQDLVSIKQALLAGFPVVLGLQIYESFESDATMASGDVPMPGSDEKCLGGHALSLISYNDSTQRFVIENSWGTDVGQKGFFTVPYEYVLNKDLASDLWTCKYFK